MKVNPHDSSFIPFSAPKASATYNIHTFNRFPFQLLVSWVFFFPPTLRPEQFALEISPHIIPEKHLVLSLKELKK